MYYTFSPLIGDVLIIEFTQTMNLDNLSCEENMCFWGIELI